MQNKYPLWKNLLLVFIMLIGIVYALPNLYGGDPAIQINAHGEIGIGAVPVADRSVVFGGGGGAGAGAVEFTVQDIILSNLDPADNDNFRWHVYWRYSHGNVFANGKID